MAHFETENIEPSPEEEELKNAKSEEVKKKEEELLAKEIMQEKKIEKALGEESEEEEEVKETPKMSLFYPLTQGLNDYLTKRLGLELATAEEREAIKEATTEVEVKYGASKISSPETRLIVAEATPIIRQLPKVLENLKSLRIKPQVEKQKEVIQPDLTNFKTNPVQANVSK
jgi:hypothetical protein